MTRKLLFSVTEADCDWQYDRGTGAGGQKRNKTSSKARCTHRASGAMGVDDSTRSQHQNKRHAFVKMAKSDKFKAWWKMECARQMGALKNIDERVDAALRPRNLRVEGKLDGKWTPIEQCEQPETGVPNSGPRPTSSGSDAA